jgi:hypothetical protein
LKVDLLKACAAVGPSFVTRDILLSAAAMERA